MFTKFLSVFCLNLLISVPTYATAVDKKDINFLPTTEAMMKGSVYYALGLITPERLWKLNPDLLNLDSLGFTKERDIKLLVAKTAYVVDKPAGFFDHSNTRSENFISHILGIPKIDKVRDNYFKLFLTVNSSQPIHMRTYFDSDDISTLPNSKVIRAVTQARKLDIISQSASSIIFREFSRLNEHSIGAIQVSSYIPLKENKTLVLNYTIDAIKKGFAKKSVLRKNFIDEALSQQRLINSYQAK